MLIMKLMPKSYDCRFVKTNNNEKKKKLKKKQY